MKGFARTYTQGGPASGCVTVVVDQVGSSECVVHATMKSACEQRNQKPAEGIMRLGALLS